MAWLVSRLAELLGDTVAWITMSGLCGLGDTVAWLACQLDC